MREKNVVIGIKDLVATITLNRLPMNAFNEELVEDLIEALLQVKNNNEVRVVVLTGKGRVFSAGGDLEYLEKIKGTVEIKRFIAKAGELVTIINGMEKPVIAMVNGIAAGAGFNLVLACDIIYCAKSAKFSQSFAKVGLIPDCGGLFLLPRTVGLHKAKELMFTSDLIDSEEAYRMGIVNHLIEDSRLEEETYKFADKLAHSAPIAIGIIKKILNSELDLNGVIGVEAEIQTMCMKTADFVEGVSAFKEKRKPKFNGC